MKTDTVIKTDFFKRNALEVAPELLGKSLVREIGGKRSHHTITDVEAYDGEDDKASHANRGRTVRNSVMYGPPGHWYIYLIYGMYNMLNIVTDIEGHPSAILIRGTSKVSGPGRLTKEISIDRDLNNKEASKRSGLWIEEGIKVSSDEIEKTARVGVEYADDWADRPYRFTLKLKNG